VLQCCSVMQCDAVWCIVMQCGAVVQCVVMCCSVLQCVAVCYSIVVTVFPGKLPEYGRLQNYLAR